MNFREAALDLVFPARCPFCRGILEQPREPLCAACQPVLPWLTGKSGESRVDFADGCCSPLSYRGKVPEAIHRYKFGRNRACGAPFGLLLAQCVQDHLTEQGDLVTWVPLSRQRLRERGFDQAALLARHMARHLGLSACPTLKKQRDTDPQSDLHSDSARRANALGAYVLLPEAQVEGRRILLVDDVVTSGATLSECCRILKQAGAGSVHCVTLAQAAGK